MNQDRYILNKLEDRIFDTAFNDEMYLSDIIIHLNHRKHLETRNNELEIKIIRLNEKLNNIKRVLHD